MPSSGFGKNTEPKFFRLTVAIHLANYLVFFRFGFFTCNSGDHRNGVGIKRSQAGNAGPGWGSPKGLVVGKLVVGQPAGPDFWGPGTSETPHMKAGGHNLRLTG